MKRTLSIFLMVLILFTVINPTIASAKQIQFLSKTKLLEDYDTMWNIIEENYPYMGVAERVTGNDFNKVKATFRNYINDNTTKKEYADIINNGLSKFNGTGHSKLIYDALNNKVSKQFYNYNQLNNKTDNTSNQSVVSTNLVNFSTKEYDDIETAYIKIPKFMDHQINISALKQYFNKISDYKNCIIDLRGNTGGSELYWEYGIVEPNLKEDISLSLSYYAFAKGNLAKKIYRK